MSGTIFFRIKKEPVRLLHFPMQPQHWSGRTCVQPYHIFGWGKSMAPPRPPALPFWSIYLNISIFEAASSCFAKDNPGPTSPLLTSGQSSHWRLGEGFAWKGVICQTIQLVFSLLFTWLSRFFLSSQLSYSVTQSPKNTNSQCSYILERKIMK